MRSDTFVQQPGVNNFGYLLWILAFNQTASRAIATHIIANSSYIVLFYFIVTSNNDSKFPTKFGKYHLEKNLIGKKKKITQDIIKSGDTVIDSVEGELKDPELDDSQMKITIHANSRTHMLFVKVDGYFQDSLGLLGRPDADDRQTFISSMTIFDRNGASSDISPGSIHLVNAVFSSAVSVMSKHWPPPSLVCPS